MKTLVLYMGIGVAVGVLAYPWRRQLSNALSIRLCMWMWACFWPLLILIFIGLGIRALVRRLTGA